ncbi:phosphatidylinositol 4,5-bisphosphate 3-kinase catalytic subunit alpha isoform-like [Ylistrum balloti]|uniref:phosphatidylinositol 4,5-bisphosphate 3-kinase catalytic subunit alpha isoform-like n=1 Tax=Ylistrum balloti TaxID=509963 RepID=UPI002905AA45|nr:phosphatidylinositol 4,5-bisphosphate 3-kinase catalytic subunit alpha isoform-like [Ylistrum balloti]
MPPSSGELWGHHLMPQQVLVDCLLPNGILVQLYVNRDATLESIKANVWLEAKKFPLSHLLLDSASYIFVSITQDAEKEEFYDETRRLCDLRLFLPVLKVVEPKGNREEKMLNYEIGMTIGIPTNDFNEMKDLEIVTFRRNILDVCKESVDLRESAGKESLAMYAYPPNVESTSNLPKHLQDKLSSYDNFIVVCIWVVADDGNRTKFSVKVSHKATPITVIAETIRRRSRMMGITKEHAERCIDVYSTAYALKVCGSDQFLLQEFPISQYKYVRECIGIDKIPQFMLLTREGIYAALPDNYFTMPSYAQRGLQALLDINNKQTISLWEIQANLRIRILCATYVNVKESCKIFVRAGVFHGTEALCEPQDTKLVESNNPRWNEWLEFLYIPDIPRSARLCLSICCVSKRKNRKVISYPLAWGNLQMFDFNDRLLNEKVSLNLWAMPQGMDDTLNPIGIPGSNPDKETPCIEIEFDKFSYPVSYPPESHFEELAHMALSRERRSQYLETTQSRKKEEELVNDIIKRDPLSEIYDQEKEILWKRREYCLQHPHSLPKLVSATKWNDREQVAQLYMLLKKWPQLKPEVALELLDCSFPDQQLRRFAVTCFEMGLTDDKLQQFLLQLVQALKFEPYLDSPIARFLLKKSLLNQRIGQYFFWLLKSEMHHTNIRLRFGLILEAFCRGCGPYLRMLSRQVEALDKLTKLTDMLKSDVREDDHLRVLQEHLRQPDYQEALTNFMSPLNNSHRLGDINLDDCRVMKSKKRPLWIVWTNPDSLADVWFPNYKIIFKHGDDLRQDMLTLQLLGVMDVLWKDAGLDLRLIPYGCVSTGKDVGVIQVVRQAETLMEIQGKGGMKGAIQIDSSALHKWISMKNKDKYDQAIDTFTRSCAGYCVATFILGIGDRHSENIMVTEEGQVFHIDFGHFLNHKKKKFGINRERVPFVLTEDFMRVITRDSDKAQKQQSFKKFAQMCVEAYLVLRENAHLLINLFTMMLSCGIPELQSLDDISYLRKTLAVEKSERDAVEYFSEQFNIAVGEQWKQKVDWFFHNVKNM